MNSSSVNLGLDGLEKLIPAGNKISKGIQEIPISLIDNFPNHPFKVKDDEDMEQLIESIKERGVITPITLRTKGNGRYELISGHRRKTACEKAGIRTIKAEVKELTDDEATILMVESNYQRSKILPSEKAFAYKMQYEAMKHQGARTDLTSRPVVEKSSLETPFANLPENVRQVQRYIRLTNLNKELLDMVDEGRIAFRPAVELSYLDKESQDYLVEEIKFCDATPSLSQAIRMKRLCLEGKLYPETIDCIISEEKPNQKEKISFSPEQLKRYIPSNIPRDKTSTYILKALEYYGKYLERSKDRER